MKKIMLGILMMSLMVASVSASFWQNTVDVLDLVEKDSSWDPVEDGAHVKVIFSQITRRGIVRSNRVRVMVWGLEAKTKYQLIEYVDPWSSHEAICIGRPRRTSTRGYFKSGSAKIDSINNGVDQKFWVVLASDVDCKNSVMTNWNPESYLFESRLV